jgi:hypothetical protein
MSRKHNSIIESTKNYIKACQEKNKKNIMSYKTYVIMKQYNEKTLIRMIISSL